MPFNTRIEWRTALPADLVLSGSPKTVVILLFSCRRDSEVSVDTPHLSDDPTERNPSKSNLVILLASLCHSPFLSRVQAWKGFLQSPPHSNSSTTCCSILNEPHFLNRTFISLSLKSSCQQLWCQLLVDYIKVLASSHGTVNKDRSDIVAGNCSKNLQFLLRSLGRSKTKSGWVALWSISSLFFQNLVSPQNMILQEEEKISFFIFFLF